MPLCHLNLIFPLKLVSVTAQMKTFSSLVSKGNTRCHVMSDLMHMELFEWMNGMNTQNYWVFGPFPSSSILESTWNEQFIRKRG
jgi:hypothetical protein